MPPYVHLLVEGDDQELLERVVGHMCALVGECPPAIDEPMLVVRLEEKRPGHSSIVIYTSQALYNNEVAKIDKPYPWLWAFLERLLSSRLYEALKAGYSKRNTLQAQQARKKPVKVVARQLSIDEVLHDG